TLLSKKMIDSPGPMVTPMKGVGSAAISPPALSFHLYPVRSMGIAPKFDSSQKSEFWTTETPLDKLAPEELISVMASWAWVAPASTSAGIAERRTFIGC